MALLKFPTATSRSYDKPAVLCTAYRVLGLYNQSNAKPAKRISKKVREWFSDEAEKHGWHGVAFLPEAQSQHGAGCILWVRQHHPRKIPAESLLLLGNSGVEDD
jgi:hypothetical protein